MPRVLRPHHRSIRKPDHGPRAVPVARLRLSPRARPQLLEECTGYREGRLEASELAGALRATRPICGDGFVYGESHNRLALAIPALRAAFPRAQYVWLVRDGRDFVCSALQRAWFDEPRPDPAHHRLERTRLRGDRVGAVDPERWRRWDAFRKCCWTRAFCNALIRRELRGLGASAHGPVQLESLETEIDALARCLGILPPPAEWQVERANARVEGQAEAATDPLNRVSRRLHWREWSTAQQAAFEELCGEQMDALYPGWRSTTTSLFKPQCRRLRAPDTDRVDLRGI